MHTAAAGFLGGFQRDRKLANRRAQTGHQVDLLRGVIVVRGDGQALIGGNANDIAGQFPIALGVLGLLHLLADFFFNMRAVDPPPFAKKLMNRSMSRYWPWPGV
jgi:hypothetical protein